MLLEQLSNAFGVSGAEDEVRDILRDDLEGIGSHRTDVLGNLYVEVPGKRPASLMLCAHMDEVGAMVKSIDNNGWLRFGTIGGIDERVLVSKSVMVGSNKISGVIGAKAIHLQEAKERKRVLRTKNLYIDIGAKDKKDAEKHVAVGEYVAFDTKFKTLNEEMVTGKAFDDRVGCYIISKVLKKTYDVNITGVFTVQEELGLRGSSVIGKSVKPDLAIVIEGTFASDIPNTDDQSYTTRVGEGPAITLMDSTFIADRSLVNRVVSIAQKSDIPFQLRKTSRGGTDAGRIHMTAEGIPTIVLSVPCRYIHSPVSLASLRDIENTIALTEALILDFEERGVDLN